MKNRILSTLASLLLLVMITFTSSCSVTTVHRQRPPQHRNRTVWVSGVRYRQVYYVDNVTNNVVIVEQTEVQKKPAKHHGKKNKHHKD